MSTAPPAPSHAPAYGAFLARGFLAWLLIAALETLHGIARMLWLSPLLGDELARRVAVPSPRYSSGSSTFSCAEVRASRLKPWNTKPR